MNFSSVVFFPVGCWLTDALLLILLLISPTARAVDTDYDGEVGVLAGRLQKGGALKSGRTKYSHLIFPD